VIGKSPYDPDLIPRLKKADVTRVYPTEEEFDQILNCLAMTQSGNQHDTLVSDACIAFQGLSGLGTAEAVQLPWKKVDWMAGVLYPLRIKTSTPFPVPLSPIFRGLLERRMAKDIEDGIYSPEGLIFRGLKNPRKRLEGACKRLWGNKCKFSQRDLRGMRICAWIAAGISVKTIAEWQGHRDGGVLVLRIYGQAFSSRDAANSKAAVDNAAEAYFAAKRLREGGMTQPADGAVPDNVLPFPGGCDGGLDRFSARRHPRGAHGNLINDTQEYPTSAGLGDTFS
jgi:hypothetical protein